MRLTLFFLSLIFLFSCEEEVETKFTSVEITQIFTDSISIRAIEPIDENRVWFAANKGKIGLIDGKTPKLATIKYEDSLLHFRAIAATKEVVFVLSIANPGVLYKIGFDAEITGEATNIEEVYVETGEKVFYDSMAFWNENEGIAMGDPTGPCLSIIITRDGGNRWEKLSCDLLPATEMGEAAFAASNSNISVFGNHAWIATGGKRARVFHSADKGKTWEVFNTPIVAGKAMTGIYSIAFFDEKTGVVFGGDWEEKSLNKANKAITNDGGKNWKLMAKDEGPGYTSSVKFVPGTAGKGIVAVGSPGISYSADQGKNWTVLSEEAFHALEFVNDSIAFTSGDNKISKLVFRK